MLTLLLLLGVTPGPPPPPPLHDPQLPLIERTYDWVRSCKSWASGLSTTDSLGVARGDGLRQLKDLVVIVTDAGRLEVGRPPWQLGEDALADSEANAHADNLPIRCPTLLGLGEVADVESSLLSLSGVGVALENGRGESELFGYETSATAFNGTPSDGFALDSMSDDPTWEERMCIMKLRLG